MDSFIWTGILNLVGPFSFSLQVFIAEHFNECWILSFQFQEAAFDADKLFLAAIDKFDAMMTRGNVHAPDGMSKFFVSVKKCDVTILIC